jgi:hypothetical protein
MPQPERIWLQPPSFGRWTWADHETDSADVEYIRADIHPSNAALVVVEALTYLYSPTGVWLGEEVRESGDDPHERLWRLVQAVNRAPRVEEVQGTGHWPSAAESHLREMIAPMTGRTVDEVTEPLSHLLHALRYGGGVPWAPSSDADVTPVCLEDVPGMVITDLCEWEGEDGG